MFSPGLKFVSANAEGKVFIPNVPAQRRSNLAAYRTGKIPFTQKAKTFHLTPFRTGAL